MAHKTQFTIDYWLDTRTVKKDGKRPVKLRVYDTKLGVKKRYATKFYLSTAEFSSVWINIKPKPRGEIKALRKKMQDALEDWEKAAESLSEFSFEALESIVLKKIAGDNIAAYFQEAIDKLTRNKQFGTASNYRLSIRSLLAFHSKPILRFKDITPQWLTEYENSMLASGKSRTTVSMYVRALRTVLNYCISEKIIPADNYPFGKNKYVIPSPKAVKKALSREQLKQLSEAEPLTPEQEKAKDFWFLSFACNGSNVKDILYWKWEHLSGEKLEFYRQKTLNTKRDEKPIEVYVNDFIISIIKKYGNSDKNPKEYIFPILSRTASPEQNFTKVKTFTRFINQNFLKLAKQIGINEQISTYWARHSFATRAINNGASLEFIGDALGHSDTKTTIGYFAGFESEAKKQFSQSLMDF